MRLYLKLGVIVCAFVAIQHWVDQTGWEVCYFARTYAAVLRDDRAGEAAAQDYFNVHEFGRTTGEIEAKTARDLRALRAIYGGAEGGEAVGGRRELAAASGG